MSLPNTLEGWLERLERQHPVAIDLGLERVELVAHRLGLLDTPPAKRIITVAGTNGKGSTVAMLEALAQAHGISTVTYTSPHLLRYNERLHLDGVEGSDEAFIRAFAAIEAARGDISLTYFETGTLAALVLIAEHRPELAILEVGLGGRLDAVNVVAPDVAIITTVAHDHAAFLGDDLESIGYEKAGIMRAGRPVVLGSERLPNSVDAHAAALPVSSRHQLGREYGHVVDQSGWRWWSNGTTGYSLNLEALPDPGLPLDNAATALQAFILAGFSPEIPHTRKAFASVRLPGRMQWLGHWCLDVAHNPHAAAYVAARLASRMPKRRIALLGMLGDKDARGVVEALTPVIDGWVVATLEGERARSAQELAEHVRASGGDVLREVASPRDGAMWLETFPDNDIEILVCGSFFTVSAVLAYLSPDGQAYQAEESA
ncbi:bifunctional tetrahydrofolate synthase/dihydrofolate synthase [Phytohalomonas tamaricis]|uniref:bifunctional tetrahydrofolate synthase/dihydrofolate synthase n=1 Tax=Phytohalomonas tamaricis TaxID=2081032 RepID=UPI000D0B2664|nr:bifunctional tetrahydrofolate synthase/dihydrofolate synthase [Phytohalomonas tamaricis]